ncbi:TolC family protein [Maribacter sp. PR1]|uniref:TolC family protein n=1 Tax=Maribacter cobaltidurans TaxID=1178778 RepID=A0ABU7IVP4_9FLAO|nr:MULTISPECIES: TolC family protein [Maribacter]MDC6389295.1 TolC family protein [Maribacter sp. PR1]MEE1976683.1 TolC family protein [Maribacter cobaltidurans]
MIKYTYIALALFTFYTGTAQEVKPIAKEDILSQVIENNNTLKMAQQDVLAAKGDFNQTNAILLPNISVSHTGIATTNPLMAFGSKLNQEILTAADFNPDLLNDPRQIEDYATRVVVQQPLLNFDGFFQRKAAKAKWNATELQSERTQEYLVLEVEKAYMQLQLAYKTVEVLRKAQETAKENQRIANNSFQQGYLQKSDVLAVEVRVTEIDNQLQYAKSNILNASNYISVMTSTDENQILKPTDSLTVQGDNITDAELSENRKDIQALNSATEAYKQMHKADQMAFLPSLNAFGTYEMHDDKVFQGNANGYLFGAELKWNLFEGSKRFGKSQKSKAEYDKSKLQLEQYTSESQLELNKAIRGLQDAKNKLSLTALAMEQSKEALRIRANRFEQGLEKTTDLLMAETQYAQKQLEYYATIFQHNYALAYVQFLTKG